MTFSQDTIKVFDTTKSLKEEFLGLVKGNDTLRLGYYIYYESGEIKEIKNYKDGELIED